MSLISLVLEGDPLLDRLLRFDAWANRTMAEALDAAPPEARRLFSHVVGTSRLWLSRLEGRPSPVAVWPELSLAEARREVDVLAVEWAAALRPGGVAADLGREVAYVNSRGEPWSGVARDLVLQAVFHGVHHRGQIAAALRLAGKAPPEVDFIHGARRGLF
jgi:uncharacterized damage-inducible protein DinB